jgi:acyl-CoA synthetase (AMP-forming)/AMP-acid ligase II
MPSELDTIFADHLARITGPGSPLEVGEIEHAGMRLPAFTRAPPTLNAYFAEYCALHGDKTFLVDGVHRLSFAETYAAARQMAGGLVEGWGLRPGERVGIAARNSANWAIAYMAVLLGGGCATLLNGFWNGEEMADGIALADCPLVLADEARADRLEGLPHGAQVIRFRHEGVPLEAFAELLSKGGGADTPLPLMGPEDLASLLYTSGSTGHAKGVFSNHRSVVQAVYNFAAQTLMVLGQMSDAGEAPTHPPAALVAVPLFHVTGKVPLFLQSIMLGRKLVMMPRWDALEAMRLMEEERVTYFIGVPLMSHEIVTHPRRAEFDLSSCVTLAAGGAPRPTEHVSLFHEEIPWAYPIIGYGLTETNAVGCGNFNANYLAKPASTGRPSRPLVELAILDENDAPLPAGAHGEVAIRSVCNFLGYWNDAEASTKVMTADGFFRTGDVGYLDEDDYLFIVDRKKDIIIRGGENIACSEVELAIYAHPDIAECAVFALPDERFGEVPAAVFLARPDSGLSEDELHAFLTRRLAPFKVPAKVWRTHEVLPRLGSEKVDKVALRARYSGLSEDA